jgi:hypothetical protein
VLYAGLELLFVRPQPMPNDYNIADVLFKCSIAFRLLELMFNSSRNVEVCSVCPTIAKPHVGCCLS